MLTNCLSNISFIFLSSDSEQIFTLVKRFVVDTKQHKKGGEGDTPTGDRTWQQGPKHPEGGGDMNKGLRTKSQDRKVICFLHCQQSEHSLS